MSDFHSEGQIVIRLYAWFESAKLQTVDSIQGVYRFLKIPLRPLLILFKTHFVGDDL